ncbi:MAG: hypothetical protein ACR2IG_06490, partial [Roseomonas sp.]
RDGFGATSGALSAFAVLPRTAAPLALALVWDGAGGYGPVPWMLLAIALFAMASFYAAVTTVQFDRRLPPAPPPT